MNEHALRRKIRAYLRKQPDVYFVKIHGSQYQEASLDTLACVRGRFVALEYKHPEGGPGMTPIQVEIARRIRAAGGIATCVRSLDAVIEIVEAIRSGEGDSVVERNG